MAAPSPTALLTAAGGRAASIPSNEDAHTAIDLTHISRCSSAVVPTLILSYKYACVDSDASYTEFMMVPNPPQRYFLISTATTTSTTNTPAAA